MVFSTRSAAATAQAEISVAEVYNLWDIIAGYYQTTEQLKIYRNYAHDTDLKLRIEDTIDDVEKRTQKVLEQMKKYGIKSPDSPRKDISSFTNPQIIHDEHIGLYLLLMAQERLEMKLRAVRNGVFNEEIRKFFMTLVKTDMNNIDSITKYLKIKGWLRQPPLFPNIPKDTEEEIDVGEAYHIWDHLVFRYDNIEQTQIYHEMAHDGDFKMLLKKGLNTLKNQAEVLEREVKYFGLEFPKRPPVQTGVFPSKELADDDYMFRMLLEGMQSAIIVHAQALKKATTNDRIRKLFANLLWAEVETLDDIMKYGKIKGWIFPPPLYRM